MARNGPAPRAQDFRSLTFTLGPGQEIPAIGYGCRYLTIYRITAGAALEISESVDRWSGNWTPLPYGFTVGFTSERGISFRNPATSGSPATYTVLYGRGPFADNRTIVDPLSFDGSGTLKTSQVNSVPLASEIFSFYTLGDSAVGSASVDFYAGPTPELVAYLDGKSHYFNNIRFRILVAGEIYIYTGASNKIREYTGLGAGSVVDTGTIYPDANPVPKFQMYVGAGAQVTWMQVDGRVY